MSRSRGLPSTSKLAACGGPTCNHTDIGLDAFISSQNTGSQRAMEVRDFGSRSSAKSTKIPIAYTTVANRVIVSRRKGAAEVPMSKACVSQSYNFVHL